MSDGWIKLVDEKPPIATPVLVYRFRSIYDDVNLIVVASICRNIECGKFHQHEPSFDPGYCHLFPLDMITHWRYPPDYPLDTLNVFPIEWLKRWACEEDLEKIPKTHQDAVKDYIKKHK